MIRIAHARIAENGTINGAAGDQSGGEVVITAITKRDWSKVYRAQDAVVRDRIAAAAEACAANDHIGYGQGDRRGLYQAAKEKNFDISKIRKDCNCDCSSMVAVCVIAAGILVSPDMYTGNMAVTLLGTGRFIELPYKAASLVRGDIILCTGHTAVVVDDNNPKQDQIIETPVYAAAFDDKVAGVYEASTAVYLREGNGISYRAYCVIPSGGKVHNYGFWSPGIDTARDDRKWMLVEYYAPNGMKYIGYVCHKWLVKKWKETEK